MQIFRFIYRIPFSIFSYLYIMFWLFSIGYKSDQSTQKITMIKLSIIINIKIDKLKEKLSYHLDILCGIFWLFILWKINF